MSSDELLIQIGRLEIVAHTSDKNIPSTRVLLGCGFRQAGTVPQEGIVEYRRLKLWIVKLCSTIVNRSRVWRTRGK
jgi:RimJ/RimL family protein N-acetyltransferase